MSREVTIRGAIADGADGERINRLAELTGTHPPGGAMLLAEIEDDPVGAIGIFDGRAIWDPGRATFSLRIRLRLLRLPVRLIVTVYGA